MEGQISKVQKLIRMTKNNTTDHKWQRLHMKTDFRGGSIGLSKLKMLRNAIKTKGGSL